MLQSLLEMDPLTRYTQISADLALQSSAFHELCLFSAFYELRELMNSRVTQGVQKVTIGKQTPSRECFGGS